MHSTDKSDISFRTRLRDVVSWLDSLPGGDEYEDVSENGSEFRIWAEDFILQELIWIQPELKAAKAKKHKLVGAVILEFNRIMACVLSPFPAPRFVSFFVRQEKKVNEFVQAKILEIEPPTSGDDWDEGNTFCVDSQYEGSILSSEDGPSSKDTNCGLNHYLNGGQGPPGEDDGSDLDHYLDMSGDESVDILEEWQQKGNDYEGEDAQEPFEDDPTKLDKGKPEWSPLLVFPSRERGTLLEEPSPIEDSGSDCTRMLERLSKRATLFRSRWPVKA